MVFEEADILNVDLNMWKNLFFRTSRIAQVESFDMWALVHKCCNEILNHPDMNTFKMDPKIIKVGLQTAEVMNDPELAAKIVSKIDVNNRNTALPLNVYVKLITMCVQNQKSESAKKILQHCKQIGIPTENLRKLKLIVLNGYAQLGDLENTKKMFDDMDSKER
jgi:pentatricopeptide repeat protein